jgi:RNA polymerase primary sigma factor
MIGAICESPMTIMSIMNWKDSIKEGTMLLRDVVDLEATYDMNDIEKVKVSDTLKIIKETPKIIEKKQKQKKDEELNTFDTYQENEDPDDEDKEEDSLNVSLAAMEEKLKPKVLKDFDEITKKFKKLQKYNQEIKNVDKKNSKRNGCCYERGSFQCFNYRSFNGKLV